MRRSKARRGRCPSTPSKEEPSKSVPEGIGVWGHWPQWVEGEALACPLQQPVKLGTRAIAGVLPDERTRASLRATALRIRRRTSWGHGFILGYIHSMTLLRPRLLTGSPR